jgi:hypothetical protein
LVAVGELLGGAVVVGMVTGGEHGARDAVEQVGRGAVVGARARRDVTPAPTSTAALVSADGG